MIDISVIITLHGERHIENFEACLHCLSNQSFKNFETLIVTDKIRSYRYETKQILAIDSHRNEMNKNWMFNIGANVAEGKKLVFLDADMYFHEDYLEKIHESAFKWCIGWKRLFYFKDEISEEARNLERVIFPIKPDSDCGKVGPGICAACGGSQVYDRNFFFKIFFGHNENYFGWGGEDNDSTTRAFDLVGEFNTINCNIGHLFHPHYRQHSQNNSHQWWTTEHMPRKVTERIQKNRELGLVGDMGGPFPVDIEDLKL